MSTLFDLIHRVHQIADASYTSEVGEVGLTPRQLVALRVIVENPGCSQTDIVDKTGIDRSTLADIVRRMKEVGLVTRRRTKDDARTYAVIATEGGLKAVQAAENARKRAEATITNNLSAAHLKTLTKALQDMISSQTPVPHLVAAE